MMTIIQKQKQYVLPIRLQPYRYEGPQGYLLRLAEINLMNISELKSMGITFDYETLQVTGILDNEQLDQALHRHVSFISDLWHSESRMWNTQYARFCPICLDFHGHWKTEWELHFYDVCHHHKVWLVDQCSSCGNKINWRRSHLNKCSCGSILKAEPIQPCPANMVDIAATLSAKIQQEHSVDLPKVLEKTNTEQTQRLIRYLGNYMSIAAGKNPLKMRQAGDLNNSWPVTTLAAAVISDWPNAFHQGLLQLEKQNRSDGRPSLNDVFGQAYHYVFKALKEKPFEELRHQFEVWINGAWKGGIAKRNKRLTSLLLNEAAWVPASIACDFLGISHQRLDLLIREGTLEGEVHFSQKGRRFVMVRRDNLNQVKDSLFGLIDMNTAGRLLGLQKRRMRQLLTHIFNDAKKTGSSPGSPWAVSRLEVNKFLDLEINLPYVSVPDEGCVSFGHLLKYWAWSNEDIASLIFSLKSAELRIVNLLENSPGITAWNLNEAELRNWKLKYQNGMGMWLTITQSAKILGVKEQVAYELVSRNFLHAEVMPNQIKRGTRIKKEALMEFQDKYMFATHIAANHGCSPRKIISHLASYGIHPVSGPTIDGARQVLFSKHVIDSVAIQL